MDSKYDFNAVETAMTIRLDNLIMRAINNMTAETLFADLYDEVEEEIDLTVSGVKAINLLALYNAEKATTESEELKTLILSGSLVT